jgi:hypothetical protein
VKGRNAAALRQVVATPNYLLVTYSWQLLSAAVLAGAPKPKLVN